MAPAHCSKLSKWFIAHFAIDSAVLPPLETERPHLHWLIIFPQKIECVPRGLHTVFISWEDELFTQFSRAVFITVYFGNYVWERWEILMSNAAIGKKKTKFVLMLTTGSTRCVCVCWSVCVHACVVSEVTGSRLLLLKCVIQLLMARTCILKPCGCWLMREMNELKCLPQSVTWLPMRPPQQAFRWHESGLLTGLL